MVDLNARPTVDDAADAYRKARGIVDTHESVPDPENPFEVAPLPADATVDGLVAAEVVAELSPAQLEVPRRLLDRLLSGHDVDRVLLEQLRDARHELRDQQRLHERTWQRAEEQLAAAAVAFDEVLAYARVLQSAVGRMADVGADELAAMSVQEIAALPGPDDTDDTFDEQVPA